MSVCVRVVSRVCARVGFRVFEHAPVFSVLFLLRAIQSATLRSMRRERAHAHECDARPVAHLACVRGA